MIAIAFHTGGALGKLFSEVNENADLKPVDGLHSTGANWTQRMLLGVVPQVAPNYLSYMLLRFEINIRASAILGFVGAGGIGYELKNAMSWGQGKYERSRRDFPFAVYHHRGGGSGIFLLAQPPFCDGVPLMNTATYTADQAVSLYTRKKLFAFGMPALIIAYLTLYLLCL